MNQGFSSNYLSSAQRFGSLIVASMASTLTLLTRDAYFD
jgi:hypothetical protein